MRSIQRLVPGQLSPHRVYEVHSGESRAWISDGLHVLAGDDPRAERYWVRYGAITEPIIVGTASWYELDQEGVTARTVDSIAAYRLFEASVDEEHWRITAEHLPAGRWHVETNSGSVHSLYVPRLGSSQYRRHPASTADHLRCDGVPLVGVLRRPLVLGLPAAFTLQEPNGRWFLRSTTDVVSITRRPLGP